MENIGVLSRYMKFNKENPQLVYEQMNYQARITMNLTQADVRSLIQIGFPFKPEGQEPSVREARKQLRAFLDLNPLCRSDTIPKIISRIRFFINKSAWDYVLDGLRNL